MKRAARFLAALVVIFGDLWLEKPRASAARRASTPCSRSWTEQSRRCSPVVYDLLTCCT
jgi:hypothetical protein